MVENRKMNKNKDIKKSINLDINSVMKILPHRYPMLLVDRVEELYPYDPKKEQNEENGFIIAYKNITINENVFNGHFPKEPVYPGVMIIEGMAQAGGILSFASAYGWDCNFDEKIVYFMTIDNAKFRVPVRPGDKLVYKLKSIYGKSNKWKFEAKAFVDERLVAEAELMAMLSDRKA